MKAAAMTVSPAVTVCLVLSAWNGLALGDITIDPTPGGGNPAENLLFQGAGVVNGPATTVTGRTNTSGALLDVTSNVDLIGDGGQATVEGNPSPFGDGGVTLVPNNNSFTFTDLKFNIDAIPGGGSVDITVQGLDSGGNPEVETLLNASLSGNGQNFFRIMATNGTVITNVLLNTVGDIIDSITQIRLGGIVFGGGGGVGGGGGGGGGTTPAPEPSGLLIWSAIGLVAGSSTYLQRRRRGASKG